MLETSRDLESLIDGADFALEFEVMGSSAILKGRFHSVPDDGLEINSRVTKLVVSSAGLATIDLEVGDQLRDPRDAALYQVREFRPGDRLTDIILEVV